MQDRDCTGGAIRARRDGRDPGVYFVLSLYTVGEIWAAREVRPHLARYKMLHDESPCPKVDDTAREGQK